MKVLTKRNKTVNAFVYQRKNIGKVYKNSNVNISKNNQQAVKEVIQFHKYIKTLNYNNLCEFILSFNLNTTNKQKFINTDQTWFSNLIQNIANIAIKSIDQCEISLNSLNKIAGIVCIFEYRQHTFLWIFSDVLNYDIELIQLLNNPQNFKIKSLSIEHEKLITVCEYLKLHGFNSYNSFEKHLFKLRKNPFDWINKNKHNIHIIKHNNDYEQKLITKIKKTNLLK
ncbi:hypothetical protein [Mycoplasma phocoenae]|uniref:Uncharacterized protein n=1 Tax=Mycoplasma phocoenae TaxID=754517 RepID=A0A858U5A3_9MOLU|nr:hypothetical protein [Mycoplasma phocoenae]QJG67231.1 hypothetical protein HGG69_02870 [Mycoplasma phocoenae]